MACTYSDCNGATVVAPAKALPHDLSFASFSAAVAPMQEPNHHGLQHVLLLLCHGGHRLLHAQGEGAVSGYPIRTIQNGGDGEARKTL